MNITTVRNQASVVANGTQPTAVGEKLDALLAKLGFSADKPGLLGGKGVNNLVLKGPSDVKGTTGRAPEIASPKDGAVAGQAENVERVAAKLTSGSVTRKTVMFDLYALMELMQEMAQQMRNAMRELRQTELTGIQANLQAQANVQKKAAVTQMILGCVAGGIQAAVSGVGTYKSVSGIKAEMNLGSDQMKLAAAKNDVELTKGLQCEKPVEAAQSQVGQVHADTGLNVNEVGGKLTQSNAALEKARIAFDPGKTTAERLGAYKDLTNGSSDWDGNGALSATNKAKMAGGLTKAFDADLKQFAAEPSMQKMGRAIQLQKTTELDPKLGKSVGAEINKAGTTQISDIVTKRGDITKIQIGAHKKQAYGGLSMQVGMMFGQVGQTAASSVGQLIQAEGTKLQAEKAAMDERLDQDRDLFANCLQLVEKAIQIFAAVTQAEASSIRDIIA